MITVDRKQFSRAIELAGTVIERQNTIPALGTVKAVANGLLALEGTDLDTSTRAEIAYTGDTGTFCISSAAGVRSAVNAAGGEAVSLKPGDGNKLRIECGSLASNLAGNIDADDHPGAEPVSEEIFGCDIGTGEMAQIARVAAAISREKTRYYLNGICVSKVGEWLYRFAATDGHRLMWVDVPLPGATGEIPDATIIPRRPLEIAFNRFAKAKEAVRLSYGYATARNRRDGKLEIERKGMPRLSLASDLGGVRFSLTTKLIDGTYPDYSRVIPTGNDKFATLRRADLVQAIHALTPLSTEKMRAIKFTFTKGKIGLSLNSPDFGDSTFDVAAEHNADGLTIGFNGGYMLAMLAALRGDEVRFALADAGAPTLITDPADTAFGSVLMPMRV